MGMLVIRLVARCAVHQRPRAPVCVTMCCRKGFINPHSFHSLWLVRHATFDSIHPVLNAITSHALHVVVLLIVFQSLKIAFWVLLQEHGMSCPPSCYSDIFYFHARTQRLEPVDALVKGYYGDSESGTPFSDKVVFMDD